MPPRRQPTQHRLESLSGEKAGGALPAVLIDSAPIGGIIKMLAGGAVIRTPGHHEVGVRQTPLAHRSWLSN